MPTISRSVLSRLRRTPQLPPLSLPPPPACSRRSPQTPPPPEECDRAGHLASRVTPDRLIPAQAILVGASPDRTCSWTYTGRIAGFSRPTATTLPTTSSPSSGNG